MADIFELCKTGTAAVVETAINNGADVNTRNENGDTPLTLAAELNTDHKVLEVLLKAGADIEAKNINNSTPLHLSARFNHNPDVIWKMATCQSTCSKKTITFLRSKEQTFTGTFAAAIGGRRPGAS